MRIIKENIKYILFLIVVAIILLLRFPYYIDAPGGIEDISKKIDINGYESKGTFNIAFVKEYRATIPTLIVSLFNKDYTIMKKDEVLLENESDDNYELRDKMFMNESVSNAIYVAYTKAGKDIKVKSNKIIVTYLTNESSTNIKVNDQIISINGTEVYEKEDITNILNSSNLGDKLNIKVINDGEYYNRYAYVVEIENEKKIGMLISDVKEYKTKPKVKIKIKDNESGSSGGLIMALSIYDSLTKEDLTKGYKIVGTGTIDLDGNVGEIGGVKYKLKSAVNKDADIFLVPIGENYKEAIKLKKENHYKIKIIGVKTFDDAINALKKL